MKVASTTKNVRPRTKKVTFLDILKDMADPMAIINCILDQPTKDVTIREVISYLDTLWKLFFKNIASILEAKKGLTKKGSTVISVLAIYINTLSFLVLILYTIKLLQIVVNLGGKALV